MAGKNRMNSKKNNIHPIDKITRSQVVCDIVSFVRSRFL